jgi:peptidyl-prolyl cis-trans isomerase C
MKRIVAAVVALAVVAGGAAALLGWHPWRDEIPEDAAFVVGDEVVSVTELDRRNDSLRALYGVQEPLDEKGQESFRRQAAKSMAISLVLEHAVDEASIEVPDADVDRALTAFVASQFDGDHDAFVDAMGSVNTSEPAVRDEIRRQLELRRLLAEMADGLEVSPEDVRAAFMQRRSSLDTPERRDVNNIVLPTRREALRARRELDAGTGVAALAATVSIDAATRDKGGALGEVARAELVPAVGTAVFRARAGQPYGPVRGPQGWNVGVVKRILAPVPATLPAVGDELRAALLSEEVQRRWTEWLAEELRDAEIEYADEYRPSDPYDVTAWEEAGMTDALQEGR